MTIGAPDGAEVCETVGLYLLHKIRGIVPESHMGLYRDDGLLLLENMSASGVERIRKHLFREFSNEGLKITVSPPSLAVDYLDVTFGADGSYRPFRKDDKRTEYVHASSNHPPSVLKNLPKMINHRINSISSSKEVFEAAKPFYQDVLKRNGHPDDVMVYQEKPTEAPRKKKNRRRNCLWYTPPFSVTVETDIGRKFLNLVDKHFTKRHRLYKIINRQTVKVSYSCMGNMERLIKGHNRKLLHEHTRGEKKDARKCNCSNRESCPLKGDCLQQGVVYLAKLKADADEYHYVGMTATTFKRRYYGHTSSFRHEEHSSDTKLSEKVWELKREGRRWEIKWEILRRGRPYAVGRAACDLCTAEKLEIVRRSRDVRLLNARTEILAKCRHKRKYLL